MACHALGHSPQKRIRRRSTAGLIISFVACAVLMPSAPLVGQEQEKITFDDHVQPIFRQRCFTCHNQDKKEGDLDLTNYTNLMQGGGSGPVIEPGDAEASYLFNLVNHDDEPYMPPESDRIPDNELTLVRNWIDLGALENQGSKSTVPAKRSFDFALDDAPTERPAVIPMPGRLLLEPQTRTARTAACGPLATSPWAPLAAVGGQKQVLLYNTESLQLVGVLPFPEGTPTILKFSRNGSLLLAGGGHNASSGRVVVWNVRNGERIVEVGDELDAVLAADISSDHKLIALGGPQKVVRVYSTATGELMYELRKHTDWIYSVEFSPDGVLLATGDRNGGLFAWEAFTGREYLTLKGHSAGVTDVSWRPDSNILASCSEDTTIRLWEMENGGQVRNWGSHGGGALSVEFTRDGRILSCGRDRVAKLWKQDGNQIIAFSAFSDIATNVTFCDETNRALAGDWTGEIRIWPADNAEPIGRLTSNPMRIEERLAAAQAAVTTTKAAYDPAAAALQAAKDKLAQVTAQLEQQQSQLTQSQQQLADVKQRFEKVSAALASNQEKAKGLTTEVAALTNAAPLLAEAAAQAENAAKSLGNDEQANKVAADVRAIANTRAERLKAATAELTTLQTSVTEQQKQVNADQSTMAELTAKIDTLTAAVPETQKLIKPAQDAVAGAEPVAAQALQAWEAAKQQVERWTQEVAFTQAFNTLLAQQSERQQTLIAAQVALAERQTVVSEIQAQRNADQAKLDQLTTQHGELVNQANALAAESQALIKTQTDSREGLNSVTANIAQLDKTIATLTPVVQAAQAAVTVSPNDAELKASAEQLANLLKTRTEQLASDKTRQQQLQQQLAELGPMIQAKNQEIAAHQPKVEQAAQQVHMQQQAVASVQQKLTAEQAQVAAAEQAVATAQQQLDEVSQQVAAAQGLN